MELVFATHNPNKVVEVQARLASVCDLLGLADINWTADIPETSNSIKGNAVQKVKTIAAAQTKPCFADDTGLEVEALGGRPGVYSARYAGPQKNSEDNMDKVLKELEGASNRRARFKTCIALHIDDEVFVFEGIVNGHIAEYRLGDEGFGYDPIFVPEGESRSFAQMSIAEKNKISHRGLAMAKLVHFLGKLNS